MCYDSLNLRSFIKRHFLGLISLFYYCNWNFLDMQWVPELLIAENNQLKDINKY